MTKTHMGIRPDKIKALITFEEIDEARKTLYSGLKLPIQIPEYRIGTKDEKVQTMKTITGEVDKFFQHVITFTCGTSFTMAEYAAYLREPRKPLGAHFNTYYGKGEEY